MVRDPTPSVLEVDANSRTALLKGGYFHVLCADIDTKTDMVLQKMMLVLSHLFGRLVTREVDDPEEAEKIHRSPSIVYLPPMPEEAATILRKHNKDTLDIFTTYVKTFAAQHVVLMDWLGSKLFILWQVLLTNPVVCQMIWLSSRVTV